MKKTHIHQYLIRNIFINNNKTTMGVNHATDMLSTDLLFERIDFLSFFYSYFVNTRTNG